MTKILLISRCPPYPLHLGDRLIIWHLARELSQRGHTLDLLAYTQFESDHPEIEYYQQFFRRIQLLDEPKRTQLDYLKRLLLPRLRFPQTQQQAWSSDMWQAIENNFLAHNDYDIVHIFGGVQVYEFAHLLQHVPTIITPYESYSLYLKRAIDQHGGILNRINRFVARQYEKWMFAPYAVTVVLTEQDREELLAINPALAVEVIPNGIDLDFFQMESRERDEATLLFVGNYDYEPNRDAARLLAETIFPAIQQQVPAAKLQIVGNAPPPELQAFASVHIDITGRVADVRPYLSQATVFVCPLRVGAGIKNKVLEALAMGLPTVATPLSVDGIAVEHNDSVLVAPIDNIASETVRLLRDRPLQTQLSQSGQRVITTQYSWSSV
ncbi:MAG: glycosyltransferase family 4 protein, partial [Anaerolineae bacterium]|nr:glycosyltransferase family 4 protein [Anaerolineae bacterium]